MKVNILQQRRALSAALFVLLLSIVGKKNALAQNQVAVLQHNDTVTAFYGINAFQQAHAAAADGDTITLSSGTFNGCNITKAITLHGAGMISDTLGVTRTQINGNFQLNISNNVEFLTIEGVYFAGSLSYYSLYHAKFVKCYFGGFGNHYPYIALYEVLFYNCLINGANLTSYNSSVVFYNCVVNSCKTTNSNGSPFVFAYNSIIMPTTQGNNNYLFLYNCIIGGNASHILSQYADYCILIGESFPETVSAYNCMTVNSYSDVFETWDGTFAIDADYSLKSEIANTFLGQDGTQVGIFGGAMPFKFRPTYLRPYRCYVPGFTTTDNQLNVEVEVAPEE